MKLGRGSGRRTLLTPTSAGIARRAETRLSTMAEAYAARTETALAIDGVPIVIWNKYIGSIKCACQKGADLFTAQEVKVTNDKSGKPIAVRTKKSKSGRSNFVLVNDMLNLTNKSDYDADKFETTPRERILQEEYDDVQRTGFDYGPSKLNTNVTNNPSLLDNLDALSAADDMLSDKIIACAICLGSKYVDSWRPYNGTRLIMDLTGHYPTRLNVDIEDGSSTPKFSLTGDNQYIEWSVRLPVTWTFLARAGLYEDENPVPRNRYNMRVVLPDNSEHPFSLNFINSLRGNNLLTEGLVTFKLKVADNEELLATHFEIIFMNAKLTKAQLPEVEVPYEDEYIDWNLTIGIEVSGKSQLREGSYINDGKYQKVWKVDSYSQKRLAAGVVLGQTAQCRALQSFEQMFSIFNIYKR